jgi:hypothetical protein
MPKGFTQTEAQCGTSDFILTWVSADTPSTTVEHLKTSGSSHSNIHG